MKALFPSGRSSVYKLCAFCVSLVMWNQDGAMSNKIVTSQVM